MRSIRSIRRYVFPALLCGLLVGSGVHVDTAFAKSLPLCLKGPAGGDPTPREDEKSENEKPGEGKDVNESWSEPRRSVRRLVPVPVLPSQVPLESGESPLALSRPAFFVAYANGVGACLRC